MSSYIQRLISRGVESFSNASSLGSVAKSQSPLAKNDQRLHELDISHTVNIPASSINEGDSFDNDQSNQRSEQKSTLSGREETQPTSNRQNSLPGQKSANARSKSTSHSPDLRSRELYKASLMNRNQRESDKPLVEETKIVERKEIYQSPIINKHVSEVRFITLNLKTPPVTKIHLMTLAIIRKPVLTLIVLSPRWLDTLQLALKHYLSSQLQKRGGSQQKVRSSIKKLKLLHLLIR